jgi:hypothetical protein
MTPSRYGCSKEEKECPHERREKIRSLAPFSEKRILAV